MNNKFLEIIKYQFENNSLSHAYLVLGDLPIDFIVKLLKIKAPDFFLIDEAPCKISHIRQLSHWLSYRPHSSPRRLAILLKSESMTLEAANALLKALEEPPEFALLMLQAQRQDKILPTIISRCQVIRQGPQENLALPSNYLAPAKIAQMPFKERFDYIGKIISQADLKEIVNYWEADFRQQLLDGKDVRDKLIQISKTRSLLSTNTSVKFLLENLILIF